MREISLFCERLTLRGQGGGGYSLIWAIQACAAAKGYSFSAVLVVNRLSILTDFGHFGHKLCMVFLSLDRGMGMGMGEP